METQRMLCLCTNHVSKETAGLMDSNSIEEVILYVKGEYGWFVYIPDSIKFELDEDKIPQDLYQCMEFACDNGFDWIMFDRDVETINELPAYEW